MTTDLTTFVLLMIALVSTIVLMFIIEKRAKRSQLKKYFLCLLFSMLICLIGLTAQCLLGYQLNIPLIYYEYFVYIGTCFLPILLFFVSLIFVNTKIKFKKSYFLLFMIPIISLLVLWTNDFHHLFYVQYSVNFGETVFGPYNTFYQIYTYLLFFVSIVNLLRYSIKNAGFFSKQSILVIVGVLIPIITNILGSFGILKMSIYLTPISITFTMLFFSLAIFKLKFLSATPIAMQRVVDRMSDSFLVISEDGIITDFNETFLKNFHLQAENVRNIDFMDFIRSRKLNNINEDFLMPILEQCKKTSETILVKREMEIEGNYFNIEASGIFSKNTFLGTLILLKDVTQHVLDRNTIESNQNILMERERLASLGQLIGGIAHNLKTPIMSISGAAEGLSDLTKEYETSISDPEVTVEDHHDIAKDMNEWIEKIRSYTEYMSDVITAVKGQAVTLSEEQAISFTLDELVKRVDILMKHELKNALITLNIQMQTNPNIVLKGNINSLVQVINNMISNAIQAYNSKSDQEIDLILSQSDKEVTISIQDYAGGLPDVVQEKLFKSMITTKGKNGTGLGLFMSYSTIRAHFNGNITYETKKGKGTIFHIVLPMN